MKNKQNETKPTPNQHNPDATAQASAPPSLLCVCLNSGATSEEPYTLLDDRTYQAFQKLLNERQGILDGLPGMDLTAHEEDGGDVIVIRKNNVPIAIGGLVYDAKCSVSMWEKLNRIKCLTLNNSPLPPARNPWFAIAYLPSFHCLELMDMVLLLLVQPLWAMARLRQLNENKSDAP